MKSRREYWMMHAAFTTIHYKATPHEKHFHEGGCGLAPTTNHCCARQALSILERIRLSDRLPEGNSLRCTVWKSRSRFAGHEARIATLSPHKLKLGLVSLTTAHNVSLLESRAATAQESMTRPSPQALLQKVVTPLTPYANFG